MFCRLSGSRNVTRPSKAKRLPRMPTMRVVGALVSTLQSRVTAQTGTARCLPVNAKAQYLLAQAVLRIADSDDQSVQSGR